MKNLNKKIGFCIFFLLFSVASTFAQNNQILWSTVRPTVQGINARLVPLNTVKDEFFRSWHEYSHIVFSERKIYSRTTILNVWQSGSSTPARRQIVSWMNNNRNFVIGYVTTFADGSRPGLQIHFFIGDYVYEMLLNNLGNGSRTNNNQLRSEFEQYINNLLRGL